MAFEFQESTTITICQDCVYFNEYGRLDDQTMERDPNAAVRHRAMIANMRWPWGTEFTSGCGRECPDHGIEAAPEDWDEDGDCLRDESPEPWFSMSACDECGQYLGGDREHATAWTYISPDDIPTAEETL